MGAYSGDCSTRRYWLGYLYILKSCERPVMATNVFTENRFQFFGMMTSEYLDHIRPGRGRGGEGAEGYGWYEIRNGLQNRGFGTESFH